MRLVRGLRPSPATVIASIALLIALGGTSFAAVTQLVPRNSVGTAQLKNNAVVSAKVKNGSLLRSDFKSGQIPAGPAGPAGAAGPAGPAGPAGTVTRLTAVVTTTGGLARSQGTTSSRQVATGEYEVVFNQDVTNCTYVANLGSPNAGAPVPGEIAVAPRFQNVNGVYVATYTSAGAAVDRAFYLVVVC